MRQLANYKSIALSQDTLLLLVLATAHLWFNPVSNAVVILLLAVYVILGWACPAMPDELPSPSGRDRIVYLIRLTIILFVIMIAALLPTVWNILERHKQGAETHAHDGLIQTEAAISFLISGKNPYSENYLDTPMAKFKGGEPPFTSAPLHHNAYLPFLFIGSIPFYQWSLATFGWFDQRFVYMLLYACTLLLLPLLASSQRNKLMLLTGFGLSFLFDYFLADGRNDIVIVFGLVLTTVLLARHRVSTSALALGLTLSVKHSAWLFLPFYFAYLFPTRLTRDSVRHLVLQTFPLFLGVAAIILPFLIWDPASFLDDTITYISGSGPNSFPIKGWGLGTFLLTARVIATPEAAFPFWLFEAVFGLPTLFFLLRWQQRNNTLQQMWLGFVGFSFVIEFFSRFFADNYVVFILQSLVIAAFIAPPLLNRALAHPEQTT